MGNKERYICRQDYSRIENRRVCPIRQTVANQTPVASAYLAAQRAGATPEHLRMLLYDGAIKLCREALTALDAGEVQQAANQLGRAVRSVEQLRQCLHGDAPARYRRQFTDLYEQVHLRLIEADFYRRRESVNETISLLMCRRPDWNELARTLDSVPASGADEPSKSWVG